MKLIRRFTVAASLVAVSSAAGAAYVDGNQLLAHMRASGQDSIYAMGYVTGTLDAMDGVVFCVPAGVKTSQAYDAVKLYLENNPTVRHFNAATIINGALAQVWPCKKK